MKWLFLLWAMAPAASAQGLRQPETYQRYLKLGRFRNALVLDELARRPTPTLAGFIKDFQLRACQP